MSIAANNFTLQSSIFTNNTAYIGGAITVLPSLLSRDNPVPEILLLNRSFESNVAEIVSAMYGSYVALSSKKNSTSY